MPKLQPHGTNQFQGAGGTPLAHQHNEVGAATQGDLPYEYQRKMVDESGPRQLNSFQRHLDSDESPTPSIEDRVPH